MGKKKNKGSSNGAGEEVETKNNQGHDNNKSKNVMVVLKADLHCEGCATKVIKSIRSLNGVETAVIEAGTGKITVVGDVDPGKLRDEVELKTRKRVELVSPKPSKKDSTEDADKENNSNKGNSKEKQNDEQGKKKNKNKNEEKSHSDKNNKSKKNHDKEADDKNKSKDKEPPVTTAVLKVNLHCEGCVQKIYKTITKTKGCQEMQFDPQKDLVTVTGSMDMKALAEALQKQLKRDVVIVPPKKDGGDKKERGGGGGDKESGGGEINVEGNKGQFQAGHPYPFVYGTGVEQFSYNYNYNYNPYAAGPYHAPQIFSDENPNACSVM